jgi:hypothetical protein
LAARLLLPAVAVPPLRLDFCPTNKIDISHKIVVADSEQIRAARALLRWEQRDLAEKSGLALHNQGHRAPSWPTHGANENPVRTNQRVRSG